MMKNYKGQGISLPVEMLEWLKNKVDANRPRIASVSHYVQCLILDAMEAEKREKGGQS